MVKFNLKKLTDDLVRNDILVPHIDMYQAMGNFPDVWNIEIRNTKESDPYFHPSGDCFTDPAQLYLEKTGQAKRRPVDYALRRVFDCGHMWHGYYQNILVAMGFVEPENIEKRITCELDGCIGRGTIDCFNVVVPGYDSYIIDFKTMSDTEFDEGPREETFKKWEAQLNCYMDWTKCYNALIVAIRKGGTKNKQGRPQHDLKEYNIQFKPNLLSEIYARWKLAQEYIDGRELPAVA